MNQPGTTFDKVLSDEWEPAAASPLASASGAPASMFQSTYAQLLGMGRKTAIAGSKPASMGGGPMPGTTPQPILGGPGNLPVPADMGKNNPAYSSALGGTATGTGGITAGQSGKVAGKTSRPFRGA